MKKVFFFLIFLFLPILVSAGSIEELEIKNGTLSRVFESNNNVYSIQLNEGETKVIFEYTLREEDSTVEVQGNSFEVGKENKTTIEVTQQNGEKETYTFFLEREESIPVFQETLVPVANVETKMPHLEFYVGFGCFVIILILFKCIVLGFKKKK